MEGSSSSKYSALGVSAYTNQLSKVTRYGYDSAGRKIAETNANNEVTRYAYSAANDMIMLIDGKNQTNQWKYDQYGRMTNQIDALGNSAFQFKHDALGRMTNRWTPGKGNVYYAYDRSGNLTNVHYAASHDLGFYYDALNRVTNMGDAAGTTAFTFSAVGTLASEDGPWASDTVSYGYNADGLRTNFSLQIPYNQAWTQSYLYDPVSRLTNIVSPAGSFTYDYSPGVSSATILT